MKSLKFILFVILLTAVFMVTVILAEAQVIEVPTNGLVAYLLSF